MIAPKIPENNQARLEDLYSYEILDTPSEKDFDDIVKLASALCGTSISLISLLDSDRQWFKAKVGLEPEQTDLEVSFCAHSLADNKPLTVYDAQQDERFYDNPLVTGSPNIRFYAGMPLYSQDGFQLGTLCVIDSKPKTLTPLQIQSLEVLAKQVVKQLELRKANKELKQLNILNRQMLSVLSHDMRSPLTTIQSFLELAETGVISQDNFIELIPELKNTVDGTLFMIGNLLEWGASSGQKNLERQPFSLTQLVNQISKDSKLSFDTKGNILTNKVPDQIQLLANKTLTESILRNLILNGNKFTNHGSITVSAEQKEDWVSVSVTDTGIGIPEDRISRLFSLEQRLSTPGTKGERGSGLGLAISKQFIEAHGGELGLQSKLGVGTVFTFTLPSAPYLKQ